MIDPQKIQFFDLVKVNSEITLIHDLIKNIRSIPIDTVHYAQLWDWTIQLSAQLIFLGQEEVKAKHTYWSVLSQCRKEVKSKADAEVMANQTKEAQVYWELKTVHDDSRELLLVLKKMFDVLFEENKHTVS